MNKMNLYPKWAKPILVLAMGLITAILLSGCSAASGQPDSGGFTGDIQPLLYLSVLVLNPILWRCIPRKLRLIDCADDSHHQACDPAANDEADEEANSHESQDGRPPAGVNGAEGTV